MPSRAMTPALSAEKHQGEGDDEANDQKHGDNDRALLQTTITGNPGDAPSREPHLNGIFW
jgi:hypothetical protein